jgi:hypothetical protein
MSKKFELPPMVGVDKDPSRSPRTGRVLSRAEREMAEALERERRPTTLGFSKKTGAVAAGISGRDEREVDPKHMEMLQRPAHTERGRSPLRASGLISATLARSFQNYLDYFSKSKERDDEALKHKMDDYLRAMEEQQRRHRQHGPGPAPERPKSPKSPKSPRSKYPAPKSKRAAFELLGIAPSSTEAEINKAYRKMALKLHPDKNPDNLIEAEEQFKQLGAALEVIKDPTHVGGKNRSHRVHRRRNSRHAKRSHRTSKSSKTSKRYSKKYRR